jgi:cytochrome c oxidase subunit II
MSLRPNKSSHSWIVIVCPLLPALAQAADMWPTNIFAPASTPAHSLFGLSIFVLMAVTAIFIVVFSLLAYAVVRFRSKQSDDRSEPAQIYGSNQVELAWTVIPILIVVALFLASARVIVSVQGAAPPPGTLEVIATGHQFWWEFRYPDLNIVTANELHVPVNDQLHPSPTFLTLLSADTNHSFWVPRLAGKTDLVPNHPNRMWIDPHDPGLFLGQCAQYCGTQHAKMLLRVYVQPREEFDRWVHQQQQTPQGGSSPGQRIFESTACVNCHTISGTPANGRFGPDLTHLMTRETIAAGAAPNTPQKLRLWIKNPDAIKPGSKMPAMGLSDQGVDAVATYLETLR